MDRHFTEEEVNSMDKESLAKLVMAMQSSIEDLSNQSEILTEQLRLANHRHFGRKSEVVSKDQLQMDFGFNEIEVLSDPTQEEPTIEKVVIRKKRKGKKAEDLSKIKDQQHRYYELSDDELKKIFGENGYKRLPDQEISKVEYTPAHATVVIHHIAVYAGKDNQTIVRANKPVELQEHSIVTPSLLANIINDKYAKGLPLYRQEREFLHNDLNISRVTMANWCMMASKEYFEPLYAQLKEKMITYSLIHADETPLTVNKDGRPAGTNSYMWLYCSDPKLDDEQIVLYDYQKTRNSDHPKEFLKGFNGTVVTDGFNGYHKLDKEVDEIDVAGCWVHLKRKFNEAAKASKTTGILANEALVRIRKIFHEDNKLDKASREERLAERQRVVKPLVDELLRWAKLNKDKALLNGSTGKAVNYLLNQEEYLIKFLDDPDIPMDNNAAERSIKNFVIGRKAWLFSDTPRGAHSSAIIYSIVETAKVNHLKPYEYIEYLLEELPKVITPMNKVIPNNLMPWSNQLPDYVHDIKKTDK